MCEKSMRGIWDLGLVELESERLELVEEDMEEGLMTAERSMERPAGCWDEGDL